MIHRQTFRDHVIEHVCDLLRQGELKPGDKVNEAHLAARLGVSRAPVREAIRHLVSEGLLLYRPQIGSVVADLTPQEIIDSYVARGLLEGFAIAESGTDFTAAAKVELEGLCHQMQASAAAGDDAELIEAGARFHRLLYSRSSNRQLLEQIEQLSNKLHLLFYRHWAKFYTPEEICSRHLKLLELASSTADSFHVEQAFRKHYIETGRKVAALYENREQRL